MSKTRLILSFHPEIVEEPITYRLITEHGVKVNILRAAIDPRKQGTMVVELEGSQARLATAQNYLENAGVTVEPLESEIQHDTERCTSCTACVPLCPTGALTVDRDTWQVAFDGQQCILCLSCLEVCPYGAMRTRL